jgi:hypothetical protein
VDAHDFGAPRRRALTFAAFFSAAFSSCGRPSQADRCLDSVDGDRLRDCNLAGPRYVTTGIAVATLTLTGFFLLKQHFFLWMAGVGGASLILAGIWLKRA